MESAITTKGQATIPKAIREHLGLKPGDRVKFFMHPDGSVVLLPKRPAYVLRGIVKPKRRPASIDEMNEAATAGAAADARCRAGANADVVGCRAGVGVAQDHFKASHAASIGEMISPLMITLPFHTPRGLRFGTRCATSFTSGFPFLVITMASPVSAT